MQEQRIKLAIFGDICPTKDYRNNFLGKPEILFGSALELLQDADFSVCNLECPICEMTPASQKTGPHLKSSYAEFEILKKSGLCACSLANNHILDYGKSGLVQTLSCLEENRVLFWGAGVTSNQAAKPLYLEKSGLKIGLLSFAEQEFNRTSNGVGANIFDPYISLQQISATKANCDRLIVLYHGGIEHYNYPSPLLQKKCRAIVDAGADAVLCQHSHCIGTIETYHNAPILYGQGNSIFGYRETDASWNEGLVVMFEVDKDEMHIRYELLQALESGIILADEDIRDVRLAQIAQESQKLAFPGFINREWKTFCEKTSPMYLPMLFGRGRAFNKINRILRNRLIQVLYPVRKKLVALNLIRCDAHREVVQTAIEELLFTERD